MAPGEGALSARTVLEVADGLRWSDPRLGLSLAEHAVCLAGDDAAARAAAQRCVIRSLAEVDRFEDVVSRATPLLEDAVVRKSRDDLAGLLVELAGAAIGFGDDAVAARLVAPVGPDEELPTRTTVLAALVRAQLAGATGDVAGADRAAQEAEAALGRTAEPEAGLARRDLARARAAARSRSGDPAAALAIVSDLVSADPGADPDGGRRSLLAAADQVDALLDLGRPDEALERGRAALPRSAAPPLVCPAARVRLALAERVHLARGAHDEARSLARAAAEQLEDAGHDAAAARAWEVVAAAAERGGELAAALTAVRHGHALETRSRDRRDPAVRALATLAASAPELPARPAPPPPTPPPAPEPTPPEPVPTPSAGEPLADAPSSPQGPVAEVDGATSPVRRRSHRRQDTDGASRTSGAESVPETLARLLGGSGTPSSATDRAGRPGRAGSGEPDRRRRLRRGGPRGGGGRVLRVRLDPPVPGSPRQRAPGRPAPGSPRTRGGGPGLPTDVRRVLDGAGEPDRRSRGLRPVRVLGGPVTTGTGDLGRPCRRRGLGRERVPAHRSGGSARLPVLRRGLPVLRGGRPSGPRRGGPGTGYLAGRSPAARGRPACAGPFGSGHPRVEPRPRQSPRRPLRRRRPGVVPR